MKKNYFKKSLSLIMTVLMIMSCWVFVAPTEAEAVSADVSSVASYASYHVKMTVTLSNIGKSGYIKILYYPVNADGSLNTSSPQEYFLVNSAKEYSSTTYTFDTADDSTRALASDHSFASTGYDEKAENGPVNGWPYGVEMKSEGSLTSSSTIALKSMYINGVKVVQDGTWSAGSRNTKTVLYTYKNDSGYVGYLDNWTEPSITVTKASDISLQVPSYGTRTSGTVSATMKDQYGYSWPISYSISGTGATLSSTTGSTSVSVTNAALANFTNGTGTTNLTLTATGAGRTLTSNVALTAPKKDVTFENIFSLSDWRYSDSFAYDSSKGEVTVENNNTIKIYKSVAGELTTASSYPSNHNAAMYSIPVTGGKAYTVSFNTTSSVSGGTIAPEVFLFWYDVNDGYLGLSNKLFSGNGDHSVNFTAPDAATKAEIRFDNDCSTSGSTLRFNNIAICPADRAEDIELESWTNRPYTKAYTYNAALGTSLSVPARAGYTFNGWYLDSNSDGIKNSGEEVTDGSGNVVSNLQSFGINAHYNLYADWLPTDYTVTFDGNGGTAATGSTGYNITDTVTIPDATRDSYALDSWKVTVADGNWTIGETYNANDDVTGKYGNATLAAQWTKLWTVTFLDGDGTVLGTATVKNGEAATAPVKTPTKVSDADYSYTFSSWDEDFSNVTADMTVTPNFTSKAHTIAYDFVSDRTCTKNAMVDKYCSTCGYYFFQNQEYDGTTETSWIKLGHNFEGQPAVAGTSDGEDGTHEVRCSRYTSASCGGTTRVAHSFDSVVSTEGATCTDKGIVTKKCACGQTTKVAGETDPNGHSYDETKGTSNDDNATHTVACIYDSTHTKSVNCTDNDNDCYCDICNQELVHSYVNKTKDNVVSEAKCEIDAVYYLTCQCGKYSTGTWTDTGSALEHNWTDTTKYLKSEANCTDDEVYYKECSLCGVSSETKTGDTWTKADTKWNHKFDGEYVTNNNGTHVQKCTNKDCTATGNQQNCDYGDWTTDNAVTHSHTCEFCGYTPAAENHDWAAWEPVDSTATTAGSMIRECNVCGREETKNCTYNETHYDATCTTPERTEYKCSDCGHGYTVIGEAATGHDFSGEVKSYSDGTHAFLCANNCGSYGIDKIANAKTGCSYEYTNTAEGTHTAECTVCKYSYGEDCSGGQATCTAQAECQYCKTAYGDKAAHSFKGAAKTLDGDVHAYLCEYCGTTTGIYGIGNTENDTEACSGGTATCSALAVCDICKETYGELNADGHKWSTAAPDADNAGKHIYTCEYNDAHKKSGDCVSGSSVVVAPTCTDKGYTIQTCKECSYQWNTDYVDATDHNWVNPVCNNDGTHTLTCDNENVDGWVCDETLTLNCAESAITFGLEPATCTEQGYTTYQCTVCNYSWNADFVPATGHSYEKKLRSLDAAYKRSEKTCTEAETYWYRCDNCTVSAGTEADKYADNLASIYWSNGTAAGHKMDKLVDENDLAKNRKSEATCTAAAVYYYSCSVCGEQDTTQTFTYKASLGHDYQDIVDADDLAKNRVSEATCTSAAIYNKSCSRCGAVSTDTFGYGEKIGHNMTKTAAKAATCTENGNVEYYTCSNCKKTFSDEEGKTEIIKLIINKLDHDWIDVDYKAPSCEEAGHSEYEYCSRCDEIRGKTDYEATEHNFTGAYTYDSVNGYHSRYCVNDNCLADGVKANGIGNEKYSVEFDGLDYVIKGGEKCDFASSDAVTDENGIHSHKLTCVCGNETSKAYADTETFVKTVAPTCTEDGYDLHECPDCDATWNKNIIESSGHDLAASATTNNDGTHSVKCSKCDYTSDAEKCSGGTATCKDQAICEVCKAAYGETTDHTYDDTKWVYQEDATCTEDGTEKNNCSVCGTEATRTAEDTASGHSMIADYVYDIKDWATKPEGFNEVIKAPNCKDEGLGIIYCTKCDHYKTKTIKADSSAHVWATDENGEEIWNVLGGDCASGVTSVKTCTVCGDRASKTETVPHAWKVIVVKEATCVENGYVDLRCDVCNFTASLKGDTEADYILDEVNYAESYDVIADGEHTWQTEEPADEDYMVIDGVVVFVEKYPAYNATGRGYKKCTLCNTTEDVTIDAYGNDPADHKHPELGINDNSTLKYVAKVEATCTVGGHEGYYECTRCSYSQYVLDHDAFYIVAKGHTEPNADGKCDRCKATLEEDTASRNCGCICHKSNGFMKFIYKILRFFWKLFGMNKTCACSAVHY